MATNLTSIHGRKLGISNQGHLVGNGLDLINPVVDLDIAIGAEDTNVRIITVTPLDANGNAVEASIMYRLVLFTSAAGAALATGGSTGIAINTDGLIVVTHTAKLVFDLITEDDGTLDLKWTDTGTEAVFLCFQLPNGNLVWSASIANT